MNTTETTVLHAHQSIASLLSVLGSWEVEVTADEVGLYISLIDPASKKEQRALTLAPEDDTTADLSDYLWRFWTSNGVWYDSALDADADAESVLGFLADCLHEEDLFTEEARLMKTQQQ